MKLFLLLFFLAVPSLARAAEPLTWPEVLKKAAQNNPTIRSARENLVAKQAQSSGSFNGILPRVGLSSSYRRSKNDVGPDWDASAAASLDLFNQATFADIQSASASEIQAEASLRLAASSLLQDLRAAFARLLFAQEQVNVAATIAGIRDRNSALVTLRYKSGRESKGNMLRAQAERLQAKMDEDQAARDLRSGQQELTRQLGEDHFETLVATGTLDAALAGERPDTWTPLVDSHPSVQIDEATLVVAQASVRSAKSPLWPTLSANYIRSFNGDTFFPSDRSNWTAAGVITYPIFGRGLTSTYFEVSSAKRSLEKARQDLSATRLQTQSELENTWSGLASANDQVKVQEAFLEAARQRNGEADARYASGLMTYENWELIVTDRVNFERGLIRARRDAVIAQAAWDKATGKGVEE